MVLNSDGEDISTSWDELDAVTLGYLPIIALADEFAVNVESVGVVACDDDVGRNGYLSRLSGEVLAEIADRQRRYTGGTSGGGPDPFGVGEVERSDMADA